MSPEDVATAAVACLLSMPEQLSALLAARTVEVGAGARGRVRRAWSGHERSGAAGASAAQHRRHVAPCVAAVFLPLVMFGTVMFGTATLCYARCMAPRR